MNKRRDKKFYDSAQLNNRTYMHYYNRLKELAISMFEWKNVPDSIDVRFLELCLFEKGACVFFKDEVMGFLALNVAMNGKWNVYNIPIDRRAYATNSYQRNLNINDSVIIYNNMIRQNTANDMELYARRLYECDRTADVNIKAQKTPVAIICDENQRLTMKNLYMQYDGNEPFIFGDKNLDLKNVTVLQTGAPFVADKILETKTKIWNEALTCLGISNVSAQKKERLISDEVIRSMGGTIASRYSRLESRRTACNMINKMFGLNMSVDFRDDFREADDEVMFEGDSGEKNKMTDMVIDLRTK